MLTPPENALHKTITIDGKAAKMTRIIALLCPFTLRLGGVTGGVRVFQAG